MSQPRTEHPFHLYEAIHQQPELVGRMLTQGTDLVTESARAAAKKERLWIAGIGSSFYTAQMAENFLRHLTGGGATVRAVETFEFVHYPQAIGPRDAVVILSHTGTTTYSLRALEMALRSGALTIAVSGENGGPGMHAANFLITTCEQENSFAYTKSLTAALARLAVFSLAYRQARGQDAAEARESLAAIPEWMRAALGSEAQMKEIAKRTANLARTILFGAGPNWATAREIALKIKETSFQAAEGEETEQLLHGPFSELDEDMMVVTMMAGVPADDRTRTILRAAGEAGAQRLALHVPRVTPDPSAGEWVAVPEVEEWLSPFLFLLPLQWLTYYLALERGTNPDRGRQDQPRHAQARQLYQY